MSSSIVARNALHQIRVQTRRASPSFASQYSALRRLLSSLAILEQRDGKLNVSSLAAVSAAQKLGGSITGFLAGSGTKSIAEEAAKVKGLDKIVYVENDAYDKARPPLSVPFDIY